MSVLFACCALVGITFLVVEKASRKQGAVSLQFDIDLCRVCQLCVEDFSVLNRRISFCVSDWAKLGFYEFKKIGLGKSFHLIVRSGNPEIQS